MFASLKGRTAVVTGAGSGIGKSMARIFGKEGCNMILVARSLEKVNQVASEINDAGGKALALAADVRDFKAVQEVAAKTQETYGGIDILLSNAGIFPEARLDVMTDDDYDKVMDTNVKGMFHAVWACQEALKRSKHGRVILTSSITGPNTGFPGWCHYGASKAAQLGFMHSAAIELATYGITVNAVSPGNVMTEGLERAGENYIKQMSASVPLGHLGTADDIANAALFLASDEAGFISGHNLIIDGAQIWPESVTALEAMRKGK